MISPQFSVDPLVMTWYIMGIHLSGKLELSFLPNTLDRKMTMISMLFLNLEVFHSTDADLAVNYPSDHHPFIIVKCQHNHYFASTISE